MCSSSSSRSILFVVVVVAVAVVVVVVLICNNIILATNLRLDDVIIRTIPQPRTKLLKGLEKVGAL